MRAISTGALAQRRADAHLRSSRAPPTRAKKEKGREEEEEGRAPFPHKKKVNLAKKSQTPKAGREQMTLWSLRRQRSVRTLRWLCVSVLLNARSSSLFCVLATQRAGTVASRGEPAACARSKMGGITQLHQGNHSYTGNMCAAARVTNQNWCPRVRARMHAPAPPTPTGMRTQAEESRRADALFHDPVAHLLAGGARSMGDWIMVPRTRYGDDLIEELGKTGASQLVLLGAGMDTRAFRLASLRAWTVFEVDLQETFAVKEPLLADQPTLCAQRVVLASDFAQASAVELVQLLVDAGFNQEAPAVFLLEGLLMYLDE
ncbi:MAG: class I SAM-dependent methyltransferase, partial [Promethearchaeia archaeon]